MMVVMKGEQRRTRDELSEQSRGEREKKERHNDEQLFQLS